MKNKNSHKGGVVVGFSVLCILFCLHRTIMICIDNVVKFLIPQTNWCEVHRLGTIRCVVN